MTNGGEANVRLSKWCFSICSIGKIRPVLSFSLSKRRQCTCNSSLNTDSNKIQRTLSITYNFSFPLCICIQIPNINSIPFHFTSFGNHHHHRKKKECFVFHHIIPEHYRNELQISFSSLSLSLVLFNFLSLLLCKKPLKLH